MKVIEGIRINYNSTGSPGLMTICLTVQGCDVAEKVTDDKFLHL